jgi:hypothetical protein
MTSGKRGKRDRGEGSSIRAAATVGLGIAAFALAPLWGCAADSVSTGGGGFVPASGSSTGPSTPMLVEVDPDRTLAATPGEGVGVFVEYATGGHWTLSWTCDTLVSYQSCPFDIEVSVPSNASIQNVSPTNTSADSTVVDAQHIDEQTTTTSGTDGVTFDATPGAAITVDALISGQGSGSYLFFVQDGQVNGGYKGALTDPLMFQPSSP